jgi:hypothetical protein
VTGATAHIDGTHTSDRFIGVSHFSLKIKTCVTEPLHGAVHHRLESTNIRNVPRCERQYLRHEYASLSSGTLRVSRPRRSKSTRDRREFLKTNVGAWLTKGGGTGTVNSASDDAASPMPPYQK